MSRRRNVYSLDAKAIREGIRNGFTKKDFCTKHGCDEDAFDCQLAQIYSRNDRELKKIKKQIAANEKKPHKAPSKNGKKADASEEIIIAEVSTEATEPIIEAEENEEPTLEKLQAAEKELSDIVITLETEHKNLCSQHRDCTEKLKNIDTEIDQIRSQLDRCVADYTKIIAEAREVEDEMELITAERRKKNAELKEVRDKIVELTKVVVFVSLDGSVEDAQGKLTLDDAGADELYLEMRDDAKYENFRIVEIKSLAKAVCIKRNSTVKTEFMFDNPELEQAFLQIA